MVDPIDEARAALDVAAHAYANAAVDVDTEHADSLADVAAWRAFHAAADRLALAVLDAAAAECVNCQDTDPEEREELTQQTGHGWCDAHKAQRARLEGGQS
jgi:hypothetical protein